MRKLLLLFIVVIHIQTFAQTDLIEFARSNDYYIHAGFNVSRPQYDDNYIPSYNFVIGAQSEIGLNNSFKAMIGVQSSTRGGDGHNSRSEKIRSRYFDTFLGLNYIANPRIYFSLGGLYAYNYKTIKKTYNSFLDKYETTEITDNYNQFESYLGIYFKISEKAYMNFRYMLPIQDLSYSNYQFTLGFNLYAPKNKKKKEYKLPRYKNPLSVKKIKIKNTNLEYIPEQIFEMKNLEELVIIKSDLKMVPAGIGQLNKLKKLSLQFNDIDSISPEIKHLTQLKKLNLQFNQLTKLPDEIGSLKALELLYLEHNKLTELPEEMGELKNLKFLYIGKNSLNELPDELSLCENLIELDIYNSGPMLQIPSSFNNLKRLEYLYVDRTTIFPPSVLNFNSRLRIIYMSNTRSQLRN